VLENSPPVCVCITQLDLENHSYPSRPRTHTYGGHDIEKERVGGGNEVETEEGLEEEEEQEMKEKEEMKEENDEERKTRKDGERREREE
jgi:hypothetical protein